MVHPIMDPYFVLGNTNTYFHIYIKSLNNYKVSVICPTKELSAASFPFLAHVYSTSQGTLVLEQFMPFIYQW